MPAAPPIVISAFQGEQPRIIPRLMPETSAQSAVDARLDDGGLTPFRESVFRAPATTKTWQTIYKYLDKWIGWNYVVDAVPAPVAEDRIYYTGEEYPKMRVGDAIYKLAVPRPTLKLNVSNAGGGTGDISTRAYAYTYVTNINGIEEESEPSPVSSFVEWNSGDVITLSNFKLPGGSARGVAYQRIYRLQTGAAGTYFYLIHQRDITVEDGTANWVDNVAIDALAEPCPSIDYNAPVDTLKGLTALPNGMMAAFDGKKLYFCEPYKPHAWPEIYVITVDFPIVALGAMGLTLLVTTTGQPYLVSGSRPDSMAAQKLEQNLPCIGARTMVDLGYAVAYASNEGLVVASASGSVSLATANIFSRHDWAALAPSTMIGCQYNGRYCAFYDTVTKEGVTDRAALLIDLSGQSFLIRTETEAQAAVFDVQESALFYVPRGKDEIRQLDAPGALPKFLYWKSKEFVLPYPENYGAFLIDGVLNPETTSPDILANQIAVIIANNATAMKARHTYDPALGGKELKSLGGDINGVLYGTERWPPAVTGQLGQLKDGGQDLVPVDGDLLGLLPRGAVIVDGGGESTAVSGQTTVTVGVYADKKLVASVTAANVPVRLPSGFRARTWEIDVKTNGRVYRITMAKNMDDLKRQP